MEDFKCSGYEQKYLAWEPQGLEQSASRFRRHCISRSLIVWLHTRLPQKLSEIVSGSDQPGLFKNRNPLSATGTETAHAITILSCIGYLPKIFRCWYSVSASEYFQSEGKGPILEGNIIGDFTFFLMFLSRQSDTKIEVCLRKQIIKKII